MDGLERPRPTEGAITQPPPIHRAWIQAHSDPGVPRMETLYEPHSRCCTQPQTPQSGRGRDGEESRSRLARRGHKIAVGNGRPRHLYGPKPMDRRRLRTLRGRYTARGRLAASHPPQGGRVLYVLEGEYEFLVEGRTIGGAQAPSSTRS